MSIGTPSPAATEPDKAGEAKPKKHKKHKKHTSTGGKKGSASHKSGKKGSTSSKSAKKKSHHKADRHLAAQASGHGFDTCTAPSKAAMNAWRSSFSAANIYIGGANRACGDGNLSKSWVRHVHADGWHLIPTYVGLQAPCSHIGATIDPKHARRQGKQSADDAVAEARSFGIGKGAPIYFDMEGYNNTKSSCRNAVLSFLDGWTDRLHHDGYTSGVYSSAASGVADLGNADHISEPDGIWFAHWDGKNRVTGDRYLNTDWWPGRKRIKQYRGPHNETHHSVTINIDSDRVHGYVY